MSFSGMQMSIFHSKKDKTDPKLQKYKNDTEENINCRENFNEYLFSSTLHGLRYVGDRSISRVERTFFACMFFLVMILSIYFISNLWLKWSLSPMIISLSSKSVSIKDMPFPALTVCNMGQVRKSEIQKISKDSIEYYIAKSICRQEVKSDNNSFVQKGTWPLFRKMLLKVSPNCSSILLYCEYGGIKFDCKSRFSPILTDDGLCCSFNAVSRRFLIKSDYDPLFRTNDTLGQISNKWTPEIGYTKEDLKNRKKLYPLPGVGSGNELGLTLILKADINDYFCSSTRSYGFKALLHSPNDLPKVAHYGVAVPNGYESRIVIKPTLSEASDSIRKLPKRVRQCLFDDENFLSHYSTYSDRNCESECETKLFFQNCHCIMYYQPREHRNISICGAADIDCIKMVEHEVQSEQNTSFRCDRCLSGCFAINYDYAFSTARIYDQVPFLRQNKLETKNVAILHTYYSKSSFRSQRKEELVGFTDFLSSMGGLLGLFMGFSVISVVELFYFVSIRPYCNYLRFSTRRRELMAKMIQKMGILRHRRHSPEIKTVTSFTINYPHPYLD